MNTDTKNILLSKTVWGVVISLLPSLLSLFHLQVSDVAAFTAGSEQLVDQCIQLAGAAFAVYGRLKATKALVVSNK